MIVLWQKTLVELLHINKTVLVRIVPLEQRAGFLQCKDKSQLFHRGAKMPECDSPKSLLETRRSESLRIEIKRETERIEIEIEIDR